MPFKRPVVKKEASLTHPMMCDLHIHGGFGVDLMDMDHKQWDFFTHELYRSGVRAFCPTTLTASHTELNSACERIGQFIRKTPKKLTLQARALGIHLEGPFLSSTAPGAHPESELIRFSRARIHELWEQSQGTLKIITLASESLAPKDLKVLQVFAEKHSIQLSLGHTSCSAAMVHRLFKHGFRSVTHLFNAMSTHHRDAGAMSLALYPETTAEIIPDLTHVGAEHLALAMHLPSKLCFVSDGTPASLSKVASRVVTKQCIAGVSMGPIRAFYRQNASFTSNGKLCGGSHTLPCMMEHTVRTLRRSPSSFHHELAASVLKGLPDFTWNHPLKALYQSTSKLPRDLSNKSHRIQWHNSSTKSIYWELV